MSDWHDAVVTVNEPAAEGMFHFGVDVKGTPIAGAHQRAGQYVKLSVDGVGEGFFAIASAPGDGHHFEFLIKGGTPLADALKGRRAGEQVKVSAPAGKGFPLEQARGRDLLLVATGSGISPIRSVLAEVMRDRKAYGAVTLIFGARTPTQFAYERELEAWERAGVTVIRTISGTHEAWTGRRGYVQSHLDGVKTDGAVAFLVGQKPMVQAVTEELGRRGMPKDRVFLNF
jgi:NAD(P)H-flavin reductase